LSATTPVLSPAAATCLLSSSAPGQVDGERFLGVDMLSGPQRGGDAFSRRCVVCASK
jgi:hypothetical protein